MTPVGRVVSGVRAFRARFVAPARSWVAEIGWPLVAPAARRIRRVLSTFTSFGWAVLVLTAAAWVASRQLGWQELTVIAAVGAVALLVALAFIVGRSQYVVTVDLASTRVVVGERAVGQVEVRNSSTKALLPATIELPVGASFAAFRLPRLDAGATHEDLFLIPTHRRTVLTVGPVRSVRGDALGLARREVVWTEPTELFVHPRTVPLDGSSAGFLRDLEGMPTRDLSSDDVSFHALREYVPGDDLRHVHWKSTARTGKTMVRQFEETRRSHVAIAVSTSSNDYLGDNSFELAVSVAGSLGLQALKEDKALSVLTLDGPIATRTGKRLLDSLSIIDPVDTQRSVSELARLTGNAVPNASVAILVFGGSVTASSVRSAASVIPIGVRIIAINCDEGATVGRRSIGDIAMLTVGSLDDLPSAMRRVTA